MYVEKSVRVLLVVELSLRRIGIEAVLTAEDDLVLVGEAVMP